MHFSEALLSVSRQLGLGYKEQRDWEMTKAKPSDKQIRPVKISAMVI